MANYWFFIVLCEAICLSMSQDDSCPAGYIRPSVPELNVSCYKFSEDVDVMWSDAQLACQKDGAYLAVIQSAAENQWISTIWQSIGYGVYWLGLKYNITTTSWEWHHSKSSFTAWRTNYPVVGVGDCVVFWKETWDNVPCYDNISYICETTAVTGKSPRPDVSVTPTKGPQAGGTNITLTGLTDITAIFLSSGKIYKQCYILTREAGVVVAQTPSHNKSESLQIRIQLTDDSWVEGPMFQYKDNPTITDIKPQVSLVGGSTRLTVTGNSLDSVEYPKIKYGIEDCTKTTITDIFIKVCQVVSGNQMICLTPDLRQCMVHANSKQNESGIQKRDIRRSEQQTDDSEVQFYLEIIGFILDGDESYTDLSTTDISELRELRVYNQPLMYPSKEVIKYEKGVPLEIKGQHLLRGNTMEDFMVHVGAEVCHVTTVTDSTLQCMPPDTVPQKSEYSTSKYHSIIVYLGNYIYEYGELQYPDPLLLPLAVGVPLFVLVVIAITTVALLIHRRNKQNKNLRQQQQQQQDNDLIVLPPIQSELNDMDPQYGDDNVGAYTSEIPVVSSGSE